MHHKSFGLPDKDRRPRGEVFSCCCVGDDNGAGSSVPACASEFGEESNNGDGRGRDGVGPATGESASMVQKRFSYQLYYYNACFSAGRRKDSLVKTACALVGVTVTKTHAFQNPDI